MTSKRSLALLGSTGSIGTQAIDVAVSQESHDVVGLAASGARLDLFIQQARALKPAELALFDERAAAEASALLGREVRSGAAGVDAVASMGAEIVLNGITGSVGLSPTMAALKAGSLLALANKESLVAGGPLVKAIAGPGQIIPVDSEHSAIAQALRSGAASEVSKLILTASGGPFRGMTAAELASVTLSDALAHPTWSMGPVVTINSSSLVNKGLEVIEAHLLFDIPYDKIEVVVHPQSMVHSMVEFRDGSTIAQVSPPDMRLPIALALSWPHRSTYAITSVDWSQSSTWTFDPVDRATFPALDLAYAAGRYGGIAPACYNAANEEAVAAFIAGTLSFAAIPTIIERTMDYFMHGAAKKSDVSDVSDILAVEIAAREFARTLIGVQA
ncbi:MAG: 1-deoxy-D-xylulose-5-phosphate reductoisomerase [Actinobacteria bacterium]|nr:1-deoxy-D-xylulose-5-phosphate reductoisomerase [Actinomycetota bacterium]